MSKVLDQAPTPTIIKTRRGPVEYAEYGEGPAVLALHGAMGGYDQSLLLARTIGGPGYRYLALSRPGYLGTPLSVARTPEEQADLLAEFLDLLKLDKAAVMAVSGGGPNAIHFGLRHPDRCWGLVLVSTCSRPVETKLPWAFHLMKLLARIPAFSARMRRRTEQNLEQAAGRSIQDPTLRARALQDPEVRPLLEALTLSTSDRMGLRIAGTENDVNITRTHTYPLEQLTVPVLVVHGTKDPLVPYATHAQSLVARVPGAQLVTLEGGEHTAIFSHRHEAQARVIQFLGEHAPAFSVAG